ncbi:MAG TPA: hypothetical protein VHE30_02675 [Polyangiaceae bacterium]|nr:hypothetical protein [Polyangiaceae bacterium]
MNSKVLPVRLLSVGLCVLLSSSVAFAKENAKKKKDEGPEHKAGMMEEGGKDPAETETLEEDGQFVPGKKKKPAKRAEGEGEGEEAGATGDEEGESAEERALSHGKKPEPKEEEKPKARKPPKARKTLGVFAEGLIGFGKAPVPGPGNLTTDSATSFGILVGGHYDLTPAFRLMLRLPWTTGTVKSNGKDASTNALGVPEMAARYRITDPGDTELAVKLAVGIPAAQGNPDVTDTKDSAGIAQGNLQRVADAASGWHDPELYAPKRLPVTPSVTVSHRMDDLRVGGEFKAVIMPKVGGKPIVNRAGPSGGTYEEKSTALSFVLGGNASYEVMERKFVALAAWAVWRAADQIEYSSSATPPSKVQVVLEPRILAQFGHFVPMVGFLIPVGGELGGKINGLRLRVDAVF